MLTPAKRMGVFASATCAVLAFSCVGAYAQKRTSAVVPIKVVIRPTAVIEFPEGFDFLLNVRDRWIFDKFGKKKLAFPRFTTVDPVLIPFKIRGNAVASVSVRPEEFMRVYNGPYLGAATGPLGGSSHHGHSYSFSSWPSHGGGNPPGGGNRKLGYNVVVKFPLSAWTTLPLLGWLGFGPGQGPGLAILPGTNGAGTPPLSADLRNRRHGAFGMIFILSKPNWTVDGRIADEGRYGGRVQVTVTASN